MYTTKFERGKWWKGCVCVLRVIKAESYSKILKIYIYIYIQTHKQGLESVFVLYTI